MEKKLKARAKQVCKTHKVDELFITTGGHIFLPKAKSFAYSHASDHNEKVQVYSNKTEDFVTNENTPIVEVINGEAEKEDKEAATLEAQIKAEEEAALEAQIKAEEEAKKEAETNAEETGNENPKK